MIKIHSLPAVVDTRKRRISRGYSSTKGKTGGRGMNGQRAKGRVQAGFEGGQMPLIKRLKMIRGKGFVGGRKHTIGVNIATLVKFFAKDELVTIQALQAKGLIKDDVRSVKILGAGTVKDKLKFAPGFKFSAHAAEKIGLK